jgi:hypothetical protein
MYDEGHQGKNSYEYDATKQEDTEIKEEEGEKYEEFDEDYPTEEYQEDNFEKEAGPEDSVFYEGQEVEGADEDEENNEEDFLYKEYE